MKRRKVSRGRLREAAWLRPKEASPRCLDPSSMARLLMDDNLLPAVSSPPKTSQARVKA